MKISYRREMKHNYLMIDPEEIFCKGYELKMMEANSIEGLLPFHLKRLDNQNTYYYEITSKQPLSRLLECTTMGSEELYQLIAGIYHVLGRMEKYLLKESQILLEPEYIYICPENFSVSLCLIPGRKGNFPDDMTALLQYLLGKADHKDKKCVVMAYGLYQESLKENYGIDDLMRILVHSCKEKGSENNQAETEEERNYGGRKMRESEIKSVPSVPEKQEPDQGKEGEKNKSQSITILLIPFGSAVLCSGFIWLLKGRESLVQLWYFPVIAALAVYLLLSFLLPMESKPHLVEKDRYKKVSEKNDMERVEKDSYQWKMVFQEEVQTAEAMEDKRAGTEGGNTVLLTEQVGTEDYKRLKAIEENQADILISYVPFIIGKQQGLADFVLQRETVSRLHVRIDRIGDEYQITDLNSTNGTTVGGRTLENNEAVLLRDGDLVYIADLGYIFT